jgi:hypothetical protein
MIKKTDFNRLSICEYPTRNNTKLHDLNIRTNIQEVIYEAMRKGGE